MCYDPKDRPPAPPGPTQPARGEDLLLTANDGTQFMAYSAQPLAAASRSVLIFPDIRGLHLFYKELALRYAEVGINALAIDYFSRTAGNTARDEAFDWQTHMPQVTIAQFTRDVQAGLAHLRAAAPQTTVHITGFCMGGALTLIAGTDRSLGVAGLIPYYSGFGRNFGAPGTALEMADTIAYPVLGIYGGADQGIPEEQIKALDVKLDAAGVAHTLMIYPGAPHSFFDRKAHEHADASADAWARTLEFIRG
jgi:carboxymethylenebutenolidase